MKKIRENTVHTFIAQEEERLDWVKQNPTWHHENKGPLHRDRLAWLKQEVSLQGEGRCLILGSGGGYLEKSWPLSTPPLSLDLDKSLLNPPWSIAANCQTLPFVQSAFDGVVASEVLEHLRDPLQILLQIHWVLRPRGFLLVTVPNLFALESIRGLWQRHPSSGHHLSRGGPSWWTSLFQSAGFILKAQRPLTLLPYIPYFLGPLKALEEKLLPSALDKPRLEVETKLRHLWPFQQLGQCHCFTLQKP